MTVLISDDVRIKQRSILWYLVFVGFSVNYMIRININISIVDMIDENFRKSTNTVIVESECLAENRLNLTVLHESSEVSSASSSNQQTRFPSLERKLLDILGVK